MGIGTTAAILGSAAIGAGGSIIGGRSASKAAGKAADAQLDVARENNALAREFRQQNQANFAPWLASGGRANALVDSFLFGPQAPPATATPQQTTGGTTIAPGVTVPTGFFDRFDRADVMSDIDGMSPEAAQNYIQTRMRNANWTPPTATPTTGGAGQNSMMNGYEAFTNSPYYQHPLQEGIQALNQGYAAGGMLQSGDAMKGITKFGQDYAAGRMNEFIGLAERQSDRGIQSAGGIAGVGINALNSMSANNQNAANALSNAAIARGNANMGMWSGIGGALGGAFGALSGSSYGNPMFTPSNPGVGF